VPLWFIAVVFVLPSLLLSDVIVGFGSLTEVIAQIDLSDVISLRAPLVWYLSSLAKGIIYISAYFASFIIVGEVSDVCLGGTASFSKAMYKTSVRGVGRLLGTDLIYCFVLLSAFAIAYFFSNFVIEPLAKENDWGDLASGGFLIVMWSLPTWLFLFTAQVVAIERKYWFSALIRSALLAWRSKKQSLVMFALFACTWLIYLLLSLLLVVLGASFLMNHTTMGIVWLLYLPVINIFLTLAYYQLRRIQGELSVELLADIKAYEMS
jgi:hypothetical protein